MRKFSSSILLIIVSISLLPSTSFAFSLSGRISNPLRNRVLQSREQTTLIRHNSEVGFSRMSSQLLLTEDEAKILRDSENRGNILFALVFAACIWIFSIPPEFRRAHLCTTEQCIQNRDKCYDCVSFSEWKSHVNDYYRNGGGFHLDFTIDPNPNN